MFRIISVLILGFILNSCGEYETLELERESHNYADSLYRAHKDSLTAHFDSLCTISYPEYYKIGVDSFKVVQLEKIKRLIDK